MRKFFLLTAIVEILAGLVLFFATHKIPEFNNVSSLTIGFVKMYGSCRIFSWSFCVILFGDFLILIILHIPFLTIFSIFNIGIAFAVIQSSLSFGFETPAPGYISS